MVGWAWGFNSNGMGQSVNVLFPFDKCRVGLGMNFVARHVLEATSLEDALQRASIGAVPHAFGLNFNLGSLGDKGRHMMVETSPNGVRHTWVANGTAHHCN